VLQPLDDLLALVIIDRDRGCSAAPARLVRRLAGILALLPVLGGVARPRTLLRGWSCRGLARSIVAVAFLLPLTLLLF